MPRRPAIIIASVLAAATPCSAGDSSEAWGTGTGKSAVSSIVMHKAAGEYAQIVAIGRDVKNRYYSNYSCGVCITYNIDGHDNEISGNVMDSSNSGTVTSNASFGKYGDLVSTNTQNNQ